MKYPHVPHTRGDEPWLDEKIKTPSYMFPTHVGMNRGGEAMNERQAECSPHTWG